ncbi:peptidase inhibitor family I36 protein [Streptomyces sp. CA-135486]|uniref:peptidase inhibitor family I36 protein n=1 Tax=Streptomyces sp. CA-135486 TaxID=3240049 RepID=UPI003D8A19E9
MAAAAGFATAGPAAAAAGDCSFAKTVCLFSGENFTGERITLSSLSPGGTCVNLSQSGWNHHAQSVVNTHSSSAALFANEDCAGGPYQVPGNSSIAQLGSFAAVSVWIAG